MNGKIGVFLLGAATVLFVGAGFGHALDDGSLSFKDAEVRLGDRLFFETRFSQFYFDHAGGDSNATLSEGEALMETVPVALGKDLPGPFAGQGINCRQCHLGSDFLPGELRAGRTYGDFSRRSPIPERGDGQTVTTRNSPIMIDLGMAREVPVLLHLDGEFITHEDLILDTLTGRNFGWIPGEATFAKKHIAKVVREDAGMNPRHIRYPDGKGISYAKVLKGTDPLLQHQLIPAEYRIDVETASDDEILMAVAKLIHAYMDSLRFGTKNTFRESGSPYDSFLTKNALPTAPDAGENAAAYSKRLLGLIDKRNSFDWVRPTDDYFMLHKQAFEFGSEELVGLKVFFGRGNCVACHPAPRFTDFSLHNNGVSQAEYDGIFGEGAFATIDIPNLDARNAEHDAYLPATEAHPKATGRFRAIPAKSRPGYTDLGVWSIYGNPDFPKPQAALNEILCVPGAPGAKNCSTVAVLPLTIAYFKTPSVRDLGQSEPYFHTGATDTVEQVLQFYEKTSELARAGKLRNGSPEMVEIRIDEGDVAPLAAFLRSLNEDYH
ncbi:MAG: hypothetical protein P8R42_06765 [Candidatus Binatia bacterium]|nr:hypothetical protein [Candidatus Binatia bacterium]